LKQVLSHIDTALIYLVYHIDTFRHDRVIILDIADFYKN